MTRVDGFRVLLSEDDLELTDARDLHGRCAARTRTTRVATFFGEPEEFRTMRKDVLLGACGRANRA